MLKKILYGVLILVIIIILTIMWKEPKIEAPNVNEQNTPAQNQNDWTISTIDTPTSINNDLNNINVDAGIDAELNSIDAELKTL